MTLAKRIRELVDSLGTQNRVARILDIDKGYLSKLYSGKVNNPSDNLLKRMGLRKVVTYERIEP